MQEEHSGTKHDQICQAWSGYKGMVDESGYAATPSLLVCSSVTSTPIGPRISATTGKYTTAWRNVLLEVSKHQGRAWFPMIVPCVSRCTETMFHLCQSRSINGYCDPRMRGQTTQIVIHFWLKSLHALTVKGDVIESFERTEMSCTFVKTQETPWSPDDRVEFGRRLLVYPKL
jgi:hypothetical protein